MYNKIHSDTVIRYVDTIKRNYLIIPWFNIVIIISLSVLSKHIRLTFHDS